MMNRYKLSLLLILPFILASCGSKEKKSSELVEDKYINNLKAEMTSYYTEAQLNYLNNDKPDDTTPYNGNMSVSKPNPVHLSWEGNLDEYLLCIYKDEAMLETEAAFVLNENQFDFYNGKLDTTYYWNVTTQAGDAISDNSTFTINRDTYGPRNLFVDGVENVRDIGGWLLKDGDNYKPLIKQGMLIRSGRLNEDKTEEIKVSITDDGIYELAWHINVKTEVDLRRTSTNEVGGLTDSSVLGEEVHYVQLPMIYEGQNILTYKGKAPRGTDEYEYDNPSMIKSFFELLAVKDNYPINFHCSIGKDRTGCLAYLVEALMGFNEEMLMRDYMFTNFANAGMCKSTDILGNNRYGKTLNEYAEGSNLQEKVYNYLINEIGLTKTTLDNVIEILKP